MRYRCTRIVRRSSFVLGLIAVAACSRDDDTSTNPLQPRLTPALALNPSVGQPVDVSALEMDLPPTPRPWDQSDSSLVATLQRANGRAFIGLKSVVSPRAAQTGRMVEDALAPAGRLTLRGTRAALRATDATTGLNQLAGLGLEVLQYYERIGVVFVRFPDPGVAGQVRVHPAVDYIEPDVNIFQLAINPPFDGVIKGTALHALASAASASASLAQTTPWGISLVRAPDAWAYSTGSGARLLVIDTGHERGHQDLPLVPLANCNGTFGACDDPIYPAGVPHGTHVTGIATALNNSLGVVGVANGINPSNLFVYAACNPNGGCPTPDLIAGLNWASANLGAQGVVNMSLGGVAFDQGISNAVAGASAAGHVLVAAAGNTGVNQIFYPAAYSNVIGVAAILPTKAFAATMSPCPVGNGSTWGNHVDFVAPWYALSTVPPSSYGDETTAPYWCGTSMATPHVSGLAALIRSKYPSWSSNSVYYRIRDTAEDLGSVGVDPVS